MPVRKLVARAADEAGAFGCLVIVSQFPHRSPPPGPSHAAQAPPAATKATILARPSAPEGPAPAKTPGAKGGKAAKEKPTGPVVSVPLLIDRLAKGKVLAELEGEGDAVDLEGDVGAVGRLYMTGAASRGPSSAAAQPELRLDLKGVIYEARMVACTSCMVVRIEHQEAKVWDCDWERVIAEQRCVLSPCVSPPQVESVMNQYMAVRREAFTWGDDDGGLQDGFAYGDTSSSGGSGKRKRQADAGAAGGGGGSDDDDDVSSDSGGKAKKSAAKKAKTPKAGATPRSKGPKPKGKAKAKPRKSKIKVNR